MGKKKQVSDQITIRFAVDLMRRLRQQADDENRSISNLVETYLEAAVRFNTEEHRRRLGSGGKRRTRKV